MPAARGDDGQRFHRSGKDQAFPTVADKIGIGHRANGTLTAIGMARLLLCYTLIGADGATAHLADVEFRLRRGVARASDSWVLGIVATMELTGTIIAVPHDC